MKEIVKKNILGVGISNATLEEVLEYVTFSLRKKVGKHYIVTPNPEILVLANRDSEFRKVLNKAEIALPDGVGVVLAGEFLGKSFKQRITGTDFVEALCREVSKRPVMVGFFGGGHKVAVKTAECLQRSYPDLKVAFAGGESDIKNIGNSLPYLDILFVALGAPKQEFWISENLAKLPISVAIGVGGAFDYISGNVPRAPIWLRNIGFEWLFRLILEPWRFKRQLALLQFLWLVIKERLSYV